jgi:hypothetical protein
VATWLNLSPRKAPAEAHSPVTSGSFLDPTLTLSYPAERRSYAFNYPLGFVKNELVFKPKQNDSEVLHEQLALIVMLCRPFVEMNLTSDGQ